MPRGSLLSSLRPTYVPYAQGREIIKMKLLAACQRDDINKAFKDFSDIQALIMSGETVTYNSAKEKEMCVNAFNSFIATFLASNKTWTLQQWRKYLQI